MDFISCYSIITEIDIKRCVKMFTSSFTNNGFSNGLNTYPEGSSVPANGGSVAVTPVVSIQHRPKSKELLLQL